MSFDVRQGLRRLKPERRTAQLFARPATNLISAIDALDEPPKAIVLDTNVYIRDAASRLPEAVVDLLSQTMIFHSSVCVAELSAGLANGDPMHPRAAATRAHYADVIANMPPNRIITPDGTVWGEAGLVAGTLSRTQGYRRDQRLACLNDALILLSAAKAGLPVLTENRKDFDLIQQLAPNTRFVYFDGLVPRA